MKKRVLSLSPAFVLPASLLSGCGAKSAAWKEG